MPLSTHNLRILNWLLMAPLISPQELYTLANDGIATIYRHLESFRRDGLAGAVKVGCPGVSPAQRYWITRKGLQTISKAYDVPPDRLLRRYPVSQEWLHLLMRRLDSVIPLYRLVATLGDTYEPKSLRWYRTLPLDIGIQFDGFSFALHREGSLATLWHRRRRIRTIDEESITTRTLVLVPDALRVMDWRRRMSRLQISCAIAVENEFLCNPGFDANIWITTTEHPGSRTSLDSFFDYAKGGPLPSEPSRTAQGEPPGPVVLSSQSNAAKDYQLPAMLLPQEKEVLDRIGQWPYCTLLDLEEFLGISPNVLKQALERPYSLGLVERLQFHKERRKRLALSDRGLILLGRRDRLPVPQLLGAWSTSLIDEDLPFTSDNIRGKRMRALARAIHHTGQVYRFFAVMARQARERGHALTMAEPFHRAWRGYLSRDGIAYVLRPDGYGVFVRQRSGENAFFLEWEQRADRPGRYLDKVRPYVRYYEDGKTVKDFGKLPIVLFVLRDEVAEDGFLRTALKEVNHGFFTSHSLEFLTTTEKLIETYGPARPIWREKPGGDRYTPWPTVT